MTKNYIANEQEFKNYMLGVEQDLREEINSTPMTTDEDRVYELYIKFINFIHSISTTTEKKGDKQ